MRMLQRAALLSTLDVHGSVVPDVSALLVALLAAAVRAVRVHVIVRPMQSARLSLPRQTTGLATSAPRLGELEHMTVTAWRGTRRMSHVRTRGVRLTCVHYVYVLYTSISSCC